MGSTRIPRYLAITLLLVCAGPSYLAGQAADPKPADSKAKPADAAALEAEAIEVKGLVEQSAVPAKSNPDEKINWTAVKQGDKLTAGTQIRTGLRAHLVLRFGDASVVMIKRSTLASVDTFYRQGDTETVRLGLGYGAVRGGTTGGEVRSDFVVDSTVATLAKRGTEGWEFWVEPYTGRFRVSLAESGLVEALQRFTRQRRLVRPGEYANEANIATMWIKQDIFDRSVRFFAAESVSEADLNFNVRHPDGLAVLGPGLGTDARGSGGRVSPPPSSGAQPPRPRKNGLFDTLLLQADLVVRPEGHFGIGRTFDVLVPVTQRKALRQSQAGRQALRRQARRWIAPAHHR